MARHGRCISSPRPIRKPEPGTEVVDPDRKLAFTVEEMDERRIVSVTVRRLENGTERQTVGQA